MCACVSQERRGNPRFGARGLKSGPAHSGASVFVGLDGAAVLDGSVGLAGLFTFFMVFRIGDIAGTAAGGVSLCGQSSLPPRAVVYGKG